MKDISRLNILNVVINRTLRKDIMDKFPERNVQTLEYSYSKIEKDIYDTFLEYCRLISGNNRNESNFLTIMLERRAASSLPATIRSVFGEMFEKLKDEYVEANDINSEE
jgi:hypothetical protein